jgi:hypothetical protein
MRTTVSINKVSLSGLLVMCFWIFLMLLSSGHGGEGMRQLEVSCRASSRWCYIYELRHARGSHAFAIFYRHGDKSSTFVEEAVHQIHRWSLMPLCHQVVRPWWLGGDQWPWFFAERGCPRILPLILGGDALSTPMICGGGTKGLDCFSSFVPGCFFLQFGRPYLQIVGSIG